MFTSINSPDSSPTLSSSSGEPNYPTHGLTLWGRYPSFSPLIGTSEPSSSYKDQVVPEFWIPYTSPSVQQAQFVPENWIPETPPSAQPEQHMTDYKLPRHVLEHLDNTQLSAEPGLYFDHARSSQLCLHQIEEMVVGFHGERVKQDNKLKAQLEVIEKLKEMVYELKDKMEDQEKKLKAQERKLKGQERKLKGHEYRIGKRYNTRTGNK